VSACPACGFPAAPCAGRCAFCDRPLGSPRALRVERSGDRFRVLEAGALLAETRSSDGVVVVEAPRGSGLGARLVPVRTPEGVRVALFDETLEPLGAVLADAASPARWALVDPVGREVLSLRADGPTGLHAVDAHGRVEFLASPDETAPRDALDVLVVAPGEPAQVALLLAVVLALCLVTEERLGLVA
jgi:hypothetical protein